jgi:hypothetical protein
LFRNQLEDVFQLTEGKALPMAVPRKEIGKKNQKKNPADRGSEQRGRNREEAVWGREYPRGNFLSIAKAKKLARHKHSHIKALCS